MALVKTKIISQTGDSATVEYIDSVPQRAVIDISELVKRGSEYRANLTDLRAAQRVDGDVNWSATAADKAAQAHRLGIFSADDERVKTVLRVDKNSLVIFGQSQPDAVPEPTNEQKQKRGKKRRKPEIVEVSNNG